MKHKWLNMLKLKNIEIFFNLPFAKTKTIVGKADTVMIYSCYYTQFRVDNLYTLNKQFLK